MNATQEPTQVPRLVIYGTAACANCKTLLSMARSQGLEPGYHGIDQDVSALTALKHLVGGERTELPVAVLDKAGAPTVARGLAAGLALLKAAREEGV